MAIPCTWILEMYLLNDRVQLSEAMGLTCASSEEVDSTRNSTSLDQIAIGVQGVDINLDIGKYLSLSDSAWSLGLQQVLLFVLIIGRWLLPKGDLTRDQLSQLLLVYIGIAADILEFSTEGLKMKATRCNALMVWCILGIWTWSLMQFTLGLTVTKSRKTRVASSRDIEPRMNIMCCETEVWGILATVIMQDGPFLALRLYVLSQLDDAISQMMLFFTCKNMLVLLLQFYRLLVVFIEKPGHNPNSIIGKIQRFRHPGLRYHSGGGSELGRGMSDRNNASTTKLLSIDGDASTPGHLMPLLPTDNLTADGRLRHSVNMANPDEIFSHTPQLPARFPQNTTAFVIGKTLPNDLPVKILPDELEVPASPTNSHSDYDNLMTPYGIPNENGDVPFMIPEFPELASVYDSDEEAARKAEAKMLENAYEVTEVDEDGRKKSKKKKTKEDKKKEKDEKKKEEERKKEEKKKEKEEKKKEEERKKEEKKREEDKKKEEKKKFKDSRKESKKESRRNSRKGSITEDSQNKDNNTKDDKVQAAEAADNKIKDNNTLSNQSQMDNIREEDDPPPSYTPPPSYSPPPSRIPPPPPPKIPKTVSSPLNTVPPPPPPQIPKTDSPPPSTIPPPPPLKIPKPVSPPPSKITPPPPPPPKFPRFPKPGSPPPPPQSPPKSPPGSPSIVSLDDM